MTIIYNTPKPTVAFEDVSIGEVFLWNSEPCMKTCELEDGWGEPVNSICLSDGEVLHFEEEDVIPLPDVHLVLYKEERK